MKQTNTKESVNTDPTQEQEQDKSESPSEVELDSINFVNQEGRVKLQKLDSSGIGIFGKSSLKSPLKIKQRAWIDPLEPAIQDTFYDRELRQSRPDFNFVESINKRPSEELDGLFDKKNNNKLNSSNDKIFTNQQSTDDINNNNNNTNDNDDEITTNDLQREDSIVVDTGPVTTTKTKKFGAWDGVFVGCILNIFGVIMFLRVGWMVGQAGIFNAILIILISSTVTCLTTLSMSAICTNGKILTGGAYYIISRALGPAIGGAVGLMFSIGNMVAVSLYLIGFAETLVQNIGTPILTGNNINDVRIWSNIVLTFELILALVGLKYVVKANMGLLVLIIVTICCFFIGSIYRTAYSDDTGEQTVYAAEGWANGNVVTNLQADYADGYNFWGVLSIFFPAVTGIMAGANISGDLQNPSEDIPKGTLAAVILSTIVYSLMAFFVGAVTARTELLSNFLVMADIAVWDGLVLIGVYAATLSSGIAALVGAPRILQAVANDNVIDLPIIRFFGVTDEEGNPVRGYFLSFAVAAGCNCIGQLNFVAPLISQFFMIAYLMINFSCFAMEMSKTPNWRPSFKYFNKYCAFAGFLLCFTIMFLVDYLYAIFTIIIGLGIYFYIYFKDPNVEWGSAQSSRSYYQINRQLLRLKNIKMHVKNYRPNILVLIKKIPNQINNDTSDNISNNNNNNNNNKSNNTSDKPRNSEVLFLPSNNKDINYIYFVETLRKTYGSLFCGTVIVRDDITDNVSKFCQDCRENEQNGYLPKYLKNINGFYETVFCENFRRGACNLFQLCGLGSLRPNTVMIGFLNKWQEKDINTIKEYVQLLRDSLTLKMGLIIVCQGFENKIDWNPIIFPNNPMYQQQQLTLQQNMKTNDESCYIDVWWMFDDGGLTMLLPHLMKQHPFWKNYKLRMNLVIDKDDMLQCGVTNDIVIEQMISKFRLSFEKKARVIYVENSKPNKLTIKKYENLLINENIKIDDLPRPDVTKRWLRLSELLLENSKNSKAVVVSLPLPSKTINEKAYIALLHCISNQNEMPPLLIMRGNGQSSLTFYSD